MIQHAIYKYPLKLTTDNEIEMPIHAEPVFVDMQHGFPTLWMRVSKIDNMGVRTFRIVGTGHEFDCIFLHCGTLQDPPFVWHVMEVM